jgi:hypothetical protein
MAGWPPRFDTGASLPCALYDRLVIGIKLQLVRVGPRGRAVYLGPFPRLMRIEAWLMAGFSEDQQAGFDRQRLSRLVDRVRFGMKETSYIGSIG